MRKPYIIFILVALMAWTASADNGKATKCPEVKMTPERLAPLNEPRAGQTTLFVDGELTVIGGRTSGFVPIQTAEYYSDGAWHTVPTVYTHDNGTSIMLSSGQVLVFGGHAEPLGIGQTFTVECYDPATHTFEGFGCLDTKRALAAAIELDSGHVIVSGNHYNNDAIELYNGHSLFRHVKAVTQPRIMPYLLRTANDDALLLSGDDPYFRPIDASVVERVKGQPLRVPLLSTWRPFTIESPVDSNCGFIGDESKDDYAHLIAARDTCGQIAVVLVRDTVFTLLPTDVPVPMRSQWGAISYFPPLVADRQAGKAYLRGMDESHHQYVLCIDYAAALASTGTADSSPTVPAKLTLCYTDPIPDMGRQPPVLTPEGNLLVVGGIYDSNFKPFNTVWLWRFNTQTASMGACSETARHTFWIWIAVVAALLLIAGIVIFVRRRSPVTRRPSPVTLDGTPEEEPRATDGDTEPVVYNEASALLFAQLEALMDSQRLYLNSELKLSDVSDILQTSKRNVSDCVKAVKGCSFSQFLNALRIEHAKQLLRDNPDIKSTVLSTASGFANETSFFRNFKSVTGMTPREWLAQPAGEA